ncbi:MAG: bifunctional riboflavin kinase/FAD synthetase [Solobacterium sp.]|nr:bifunctional riboflavin kinase/FAD synthetase [Solobacterium sp.]
MRIDTISLNYTYKPKTPVAACIGFFDGVHKGHQKLIQKTIERAKELNCASALITFEPDPWVTIRHLPVDQLEHLTTARQKNNLVIEQGINNIYVLDFTPEMAALSPDDFLIRVLGQLNLKALVCGYDFHYGAGGQGNAETLTSRLLIPVDIVDEVSFEGAKISSSRICEAVKQGDFYQAYQLLGHPFTMDGIVAHGAHKGTAMGVPTANISYNLEYVLPKTGVYSAHVSVKGKMYGAMVNVGHNPTMNYKESISVEAHLFNFHEDIYGERISVIFEQYIRPEMQFSSVDNLIMQLERDKIQVRRILGL